MVLSVFNSLTKLNDFTNGEATAQGGQVISQWTWPHSSVMGGTSSNPFLKE